jgi:hypothetical protein
LLAGLAIWAALASWGRPAAAQPIVLERIVERPSGQATAKPQPLQPGADWYDQPFQVEGVSRLRIVSPEENVAAALQFYPDPDQPGALRLRVVLFTNPHPLEYRLLGESEVIAEGRRQRAREHRPLRGIVTELQGAAGRVTRIIVQDDHGAALRWSQSGETLVLEAIPPEAGGRPVGAARPWYEDRLLTFIDYDLLGGGYLDNALGEWIVLDSLSARFNGFFSTSGTLLLGRLVLRTQAWRSERAALWAEGGGAFWQELDANNAAADEDLTWVAGATAVYRLNAWGAAVHLATVNGPLVMEIYAGWQATRWLGLFLAWHSFRGQSGFAGGAGIDF